MIKNPLDERLVYLALKNVFKGLDAQLRRPQKIRKQIQKHRTKSEVYALITEHSMENVCNAAKTLLENGIFASTLRAEIRFPGVFDISPAQSAERVVTEAKAARSDVNAIRDAAAGHQGTWTSEPVFEDEAHKDEAPKDEAPKDEAHKDEAHKDEAPKDEAYKDEANKGKAKQSGARLSIPLGPSFANRNRVSKFDCSVSKAFIFSWGHI